MAFIFKKKKGPSELVASVHKHIALLQQKPPDEKQIKKSLEKLSLHLSSMKLMMYGDTENEVKEPEVNKLVDDLFATNLLVQILENIKILEFEARKDVSSIYQYVLRNRKAGAVDYVKNHPEILRKLVDGYTDSEIALNSGSILREVLRHEELDALVLYEPTLFNPFFDYVQLSTFDVASDAFSTFKTMLTKHKVLGAKFLETHFDEFCQKYSVLLQSSNYVTKRQSLKLLGELLLNRSNFNIMMQYINNPQNLKIMMNLLKGNTKAIQAEAFHVFKIFVANPRKSPPIVEILARNKAKLIDFLHKFNKADDDQFTEEKKSLIRTLEALDDTGLTPDTTDSDAESSNQT